MLPLAFWSGITNIGDSTAMVPVAAAIAVWLFVKRDPGAAGLWLASFSAGALIVVATKIAFIGWGIGFTPLNFTGLSGHATLSTAIFVTVGYLVVSNDEPSRRRCATSVGAILGLVIAASRVILHRHSLSEAMSGWILGLLIALGFIGLSRNLGARQIPRSVVAACAMLLISITWNYQAPSQRWIAELAFYLSGRSAPYVQAS
jgi:membrane-associated phospholipid phosphatase